MPLLLARGPSPQLLLIPPFAESAKDGAPDPLWQGKKYSPIPFDLSLVFITLGEPQAHGDTAEPVPFQDRVLINALKALVYVIF